MSNILCIFLSNNIGPIVNNLLLLLKKEKNTYISPFTIFCFEFLNIRVVRMYLLSWCYIVNISNLFLIYNFIKGARCPRESFREKMNDMYWKKVVFIFHYEHNSLYFSFQTILDQLLINYFSLWRKKKKYFFVYNFLLWIPAY